MNRTRLAVAGAAAAAFVLAGGGVAIAGGDDDDGSDTAIEGPALQQAEDAALAETRGGEVTGTEQEDEESYYEVEVTLGDGTEVDVQLDKDFIVVGTESESGDEESGSDG